MSLFMYDAQAAVYSAINGISCTLFDKVPDQAEGLPFDQMPYAVIGHDNAEPFDTDNRVGEVVTVQIDLWSGADGKAEVKLLLKQIYARLHRAELSRPDCTIVSCLHTFSSIPDVGANSYVHGFCRYRLTIQEN